MNSIRKFWKSLLPVLLVCLLTGAQAEESISQAVEYDPEQEVVKDFVSEEDASEQFEAILVTELDEEVPETEEMLFNEDAEVVDFTTDPAELVEIPDAGDVLSVNADQPDEVSNPAMNDVVDDFIIDGGVLKSYSGSGGDIIIPYGVTSIADEAFYSKGNIRTVTIPNTVTSIGTQAFASCYNLTDVTISNSVTYIGSNAFSGCAYNLTLHVNCNSYAQNWARSGYGNGYNYKMAIENHAEEIIPAVAATCTRDGNTEGSWCRVCGDTLKESTPIYSTGHHWTYLSSRQPTCTVDGLTSGVACSACGEVYSEQLTIPSLGHLENHQYGYAASYFHPGLTDGSVCIRCGAVLVVQQPIPAFAPSSEFHMSSNAIKNVVAGEQFQIVLDNGLVAKSFMCNKKKVARVTKSGLVTIRKKGSAKITIRLTNGQKLILRLKAGRNKIDGLCSKPDLSSIFYGDEIYLKSLEIVSPNKVVAEYWLLFKRLASMSTTGFSNINVTIKADDKVIVDGIARNVKVRTKGMTVKSFKVTFKGNAVKNTNINLQHYRSLNGTIKESGGYVIKLRY